MPCLSAQKLSIVFILALSIVLNVIGADPVEAKKRRRKPAPSPVKILDVGISPKPFVIGRSPLKISMMVQLPQRLRDSNVLEVSALITSSTRRSMGFVSHRLDLRDPSITQSIGTFPVELVWDGKDQHNRLISDGSYFYEVQAKLMKDNGNGPRTKVVSRRVHGTLEALAYEGEILPPVLSETEEGEDQEGTPSEEQSEEETPIVEEGLKETDEPVNPEEVSTGDGEEALNENEENGMDPSSGTKGPESPTESQTHSPRPSEPSPSG